MSEIFQVTARKWRPMRFDDVVGQDHITRTLKNAVREDRLAHGYLFTGQRGCGKTTVARILAKAINCPNAKTNDFEPCNTCEVCLAITDGRSMDVSEIDGASNNSVDDVRMLRENVKYPPLQGKYKVIIIDEVHMLSSQAFNALLKTLEEPPQYLVFVFATTEVQKVLPTILSRTQRYDFRRMQVDEIIGQLRMIADSDKITIDDDALLIISKKGDGSMRDAQSIFDQVVAYCGMTVDTNHVREALNLIDADFYFDVTDAISAREPKRAFELSNQIISRGYDTEEFFLGLLEHFRNILTASIMQSTKLIEVSKSHQDRYVLIALDFEEGDLLRLIRLAQNGLEKLKTAQQPRIVLEVALVEMMILERAIEINQLIQEIRGLKGQSLPQAAGAQPPAATPASRAPAPDRPPIARAAASIASTKEAPRKSTSTSEQSQSNDAPVDTGAASFPDNDVVAARWAGFGDFLKAKSRSLYSLFHEIEFCGIRRATIYLSLPEKTQRDMLTHAKAEVTNYLREYFSAPVMMEIGVRDDMRHKAGSPIVMAPEVVTTVTATSVARPEDRSPLEEALMSEFGAREV